MLVPGVILQNRYQVMRLLGQGGFGAVYQANDLRLGQTIALKENMGGDPRQFQQEALILASLRHPNLPRVSDHFVEPNGAQYLVMDFVQGEDLESLLQRQGALPEAEVLAWFDQILDAVAYLHSRNVIHRDIKPANIKITPAGQAVLVDFGIAKVSQPGQLTMSGARAMGSPGFAAPEQYRGGTDQRSDVYSLGATLYALLTGSAPPDAQALERRTATLTPPRLLNSALSAQSDRVILQAMTIAPDQRFQSVMAMRQAVNATNFQPTLLASQPPPPYAFAGRPRLIGGSRTIAVLSVLLAAVIMGCALLYLLYVVVSGRVGGHATPTSAIASVPTAAIPTITLQVPTDTPLPPPTLVVSTTDLLTPTRTPAAARPTATKKSASSTSSGPTPTKTPNIPPGLYVTGLQVDPAKPNIGDTLQFTVNFLNTTGSVQTYTWIVRVFQCPEQCDTFKTSYGETTKRQDNIATGAANLVSDRHIIIGQGRCDYVAMPFYIDQSNQQVVPFTTTNNGLPLYAHFTVCH